MIDFNINNYLRISLSDVILVLISTSLIILMARKFFWDKLQNYIQKRQNLIQSNIDESELLKSEAVQIKAQYNEKMKNAGQEAHAIIETAKAQADQEKTKIIGDAKMQAARIEKDALDNIEREKRKAEKDMRAAISDVAIAAASQLLQKDVDNQIQRDYVDSFIDEAGAQEW